MRLSGFACQIDDPASVLGAADLNGFTALIVAAQNGHTDVADWLLGELKVSPNACTKVSCVIVGQYTENTSGCI